MHIYANTRKDGSKFYLGKQDFGFIYGDEKSGLVAFCSNSKELKKKHSNINPTHSLIVQSVKAPKILDAIPFMLTKHSMDTVFRLAEDM